MPARLVYAFAPLAHGFLPKMELGEALLSDTYRLHEAQARSRTPRSIRRTDRQMPRLRRQSSLNHHECPGQVRHDNLVC
jgi:hypothetical protein